MTKSSNPNAVFDAVIVGTGPAGLAAALAVSEVCDRVAVVGPQPKANGRKEDRRTAALFAGSIELLKNLDVWHACKDECAPLEGIRLLDARAAFLRAPEVLFSAADVDRLVFGYNVPNWILSTALGDAVEARSSKNLHWIETSAVTSVAHHRGARKVLCAEGQAIEATYVIGADGRNSVCRQAAEIDTQTWSYPQTAVTCTFQHSRAHHNISTEFHSEHGPCTVVPMPGNASSLVWVTRTAHAEELMACDETQFAHHLEERLNGLLGDVTNITPRTAFPLGAMLAKRFAKDGIFLVGEAGHVMPPIGAQGLNLGLRDAAELADIFAGTAPNLSATDASHAYDTRRRFDVHSRTGAVDLFNRSLLSSMLPAHLMRSAGLHLLRAFGPLKRWVIREGLTPSGTSATLLQPGGLQRLRAKGDKIAKAS